MKLDKQIDCVKRELVRRDFSYPGLLRAGRISAETATLEQYYMQQVLETLTQLRGIVK
jgi:hypothetical protein